METLTERITVSVLCLMCDKDDLYYILYIVPDRPESQNTHMQTNIIRVGVMEPQTRISLAVISVSARDQTCLFFTIYYVFTV